MTKQKGISSLVICKNISYMESIVLVLILILLIIVIGKEKDER